MSAVLGGLVGLAGSAVPAAIEFFQKKEDRKHELAMKQLEMEAAKAGHQFQAQSKALDADIEEIKGLYAHDTSLSGANKLMDALRASVRPVITYVFFAFFLTVKVTGLHIAVNVQNVPIAQALVAIWDPNTDALFAAIVGFWFGSRAISQYRLQNARHAALYGSAPTVLVRKQPANTTPSVTPSPNVTKDGDWHLNKG
jgi:hypothetical protein